MSDGQNQWFTAVEIAKIRDLSPGYVKNLASEHRWRRLGTNPQRYHIFDVMETLGSARDRQT